MNYFNVQTDVLRADPFNQASPAALGAWLRVGAYCANQENGGRIKGAKRFTPRGYLAALNLTKAEVIRAAPLLAFDGEDLVVLRYPEAQEKTYLLKRETARRNGRVGGERAQKGRTSSRQSDAASTPTLDPTLDPISDPILCVSPGSVREKECNEMGREGDQSSTPLAPNASQFSQSTDDGAAWLARLAAEWPGIDIPAQLAKAHKKRKGDVERGWFENVWLPGVTPMAPVPTAGAAAVTSMPLEPEGWREVFPDYIHRDKPWSEIPADGRLLIASEMKKRREGAA